MVKIKPNVGNVIVDEKGNQYPSIRSLAKKIGVSRMTINRRITEKGKYTKDGHTYTLYSESSEKTENDKKIEEYEKIIESQEYKEFLNVKNTQGLPFETYNIELKKHKNGTRYAIALFSDAHIEEVVKPQMVQYLNEYNLKIAEERIKCYFSNLVSCLNEDHVDTLIFASLGDTISGYIHEELSQTNSLSPLEATLKAQSLILSGLQFICKNSNLKKIVFIGIVGNHSRTTKKIQHSNGFRMSYEWLMYMNIKEQAKLLNLPIEFHIPESEMAILETDDSKRYIFIHGFQIKSGGSGTVCGIYPALNRLSMKWDKTFKQDKIFMGHFHTCVSIPNATVNGSIIGYNTFALTNGFQYEEPAQMYEVYDSEIGQLLTRKIYCK